MQLSFFKLYDFAGEVKWNDDKELLAIMEVAVRECSTK